MRMLYRSEIYIVSFFYTVQGDLAARVRRVKTSEQWPVRDPAVLSRLLQERSSHADGEEAEA